MTKKIVYFLYFFLCLNVISKGQLYEDFSDGNFTVNPVWTGDTSSFFINNSFQIQSKNSVANSSFSIITENKLSHSVEWQYWMRLDFNPSSANFVDTYLMASDSSLNSNSNTGYFVRAGNTDDEISLYRRDKNGIAVKIIDGENGILNHSNNILKIKVTRDSGSQWNLYRDATETGNSFIQEGSINDATYNSSLWFGFLIKQSSPGFFQKHFIDNIEIKSFVPDISPPEIISVTAISSSKVDVLFNETIDKSSNIFSNYSANNGLGMPNSVTLDAQNPLLVHLTFDNKFTNGYAYTLTVNGVKDNAGNAIINALPTFSFNIPKQYDIVIDEIFADPSPKVGLPGYEWIELKNTSAFPINLKGWRVSDLTGASGEMPVFILQPDSFVIVSSSTALADLSFFGRTISVSNFPSLDNDNDLISISDSYGTTIHAVQYSSDWYQNELKKDGGWSLEMIDTKNPCAGFSNWKASKDNSGGTPARKNSIDAINKDEDGPKLLNAFASDPSTIILTFNEPLDIMKAASLNNYSFDNGLSAINAKAIAPLFDKIIITIDKSISEGIIYKLKATNVSDCSGNAIGLNNEAKFGLSQDADSFDLVINEILFNPLPLGVDYVELYNRSDKIINLSKIFIANRNSSSQVSSINQVSTQNFLFFPKDFVAITTDPQIVKSQYITKNPDAVLKIKSLPSYSNDKGNVIILNDQGNMIDEVEYSDKWHFPLLHNTKGVSLERINYDEPSVRNNFHSAATSVGYGTPGYKNSQDHQVEKVHGEITVSPEIFSPDNDGNDDFATINYSFPSPGYVVNITIFDASGRPVRYLEQNALSGTKGYYRWDGLDDKKRKLPQGIYIIYAEIFNKEGNKKQLKNSIVLARRNN
ncbi:MAG: lamin tail domain-containing protein [Ginsengibacter sp.]